MHLHTPTPSTEGFREMTATKEEAELSPQRSMNQVKKLEELQYFLREREIWNKEVKRKHIRHL